MKSATRFLKRFACLALAAILSLTCLAACGGGEGGGSRSPAVGHFKGGDISYGIDNDNHTRQDG